MKKLDGSLPKRFDPDQMPKLKEDQVVWWDETHKKCTIGGQGQNTNFYIRFPRDKNGKLDMDNGAYDPKEVLKRSMYSTLNTNMKFVSV